MRSERTQTEAKKLHFLEQTAKVITLFAPCDTEGLMVCLCELFLMNNMLFGDIKDTEENKVKSFSFLNVKEKCLR